MKELPSILPLIGEVFKSLLIYNPLLRFLSYSWVIRPRPIIPFNHQVEIFDRCVLRRPVRLFIGDEIGLGKTVEAIRLLKHLMSVGGLKRALIIVPPTLLEQWKEPHVGDLWAFGIEPVVIDRREARFS